ncbi:MAG: 6-bladed beta-propeller [Bacteroidaceae bacterium]|nr:6-bladed beta-propeller [Bacteroidaceae bacterium]
MAEEAATYVDSFVVLKPDNPNNKAYLSSFERLLSLPDRMYVVDRRGNKVVAFDDNGKFIASTLPKVGRAKNEYLRIMDAAADISTERVYISCDSPYQIMVCDRNLNVIECIKMDVYFKEIVVDGKCLYALLESEDKSGGFELRCYDKDSLSGTYQMLFSNDQVIRGVGGAGKSMTSNGAEVYVCMPFDNVINELKDGEVLESWGIDFGYKAFSYEDSKELSPNTFFSKNGDKIWAIQNICASDSLLFFNTNEFGVYIMDKIEGSVTRYENLYNQRIGVSSSWMLPWGGSKGIPVIAYKISANILSQYKEYQDEYDTAELSNSIKELYCDYMEDDNDLIVFGHIKGNNGK